MPCQSDYLQASGQEMESQRVCGFLVYLYTGLGKKLPKWIVDASEDYYGNINRLDEATKILCECIRSLTKAEVDSYIYDAHKEQARKLASWWERHQEWDKRRVTEENETRKKIIAKERALKKLTNEEIEALGLNND